jgi:hypothetical protein
MISSWLVDSGRRRKFACVSFIKRVVARVILTEGDQAAHTVVIKGVQTFHNNASQEYSDLDVMQMLGRAVRLLYAIRLCVCEAHGGRCCRGDRNSVSDFSYASAHHVYPN